jgi:hypothetical protein
MNAAGTGNSMIHSESKCLRQEEVEEKRRTKKINQRK